MPNGTVNGAGPCPIGNPPRSDIPDGLVQVRQSILVAPSEVVTPAIEGVGRNFHAQAPVRQDGSASLNLDRVGATRG